MAVTRALACVLRRLNVYVHDDANVCFRHAGLLGGRCLGRRCRVLFKYPYILVHFAAAVFARGRSLPEGQKKIVLHLCNVLSSYFQCFNCLAHLHNFIYLLMWHFCFTVHVSFKYI